MTDIRAIIGRSITGNGFTLTLDPPVTQINDSDVDGKVVFKLELAPGLNLPPGSKYWFNYKGEADSSGRPQNFFFMFQGAVSKQKWIFKQKNDKKFVVRIKDSDSDQDDSPNTKDGAQLHFAISALTDIPDTAANRKIAKGLKVPLGTSGSGASGSLDVF